MPTSKAVWTLILSLPITTLVGGVVWALDTRYITVSDLQQFADQQYQQQIERQVRELRLKKHLDMADAYEEALLEELERELYDQ